MTNDEEYLFAWKNSGMQDSVIAAKLNMTVEQVQKFYERIKRHKEEAKPEGREELIKAVNVLCLQYQLMGETLKHLAANLSEPVTLNEILELMPDHPNDEDCARSILEKFTVLRPFKASELEELLKNLGQN